MSKPKEIKVIGTPNKQCPAYHGLGWVCENHPDKAWDKKAGCDCGDGMPCEYNQGDEPDRSSVTAEFVEITLH